MQIGYVKMIKLLLATIFAASQIWSDPGIMVEIDIFVPDYNPGPGVGPEDSQMGMRYLCKSTLY